jgi:hypothetical protein
MIYKHSDSPGESTTFRSARNSECERYGEDRLHVSGTKPLMPVQQQVKPDKLGKGIGFAVIVCGLLLNDWVITNVLSPDGNIEQVAVHAIIWIIDALLIVAGVISINHPQFGRGLLLIFLPVLSMMACSFAVFVLLELFPTLIPFMPFSSSDYYKQKARFIPDNELIFKHRPFSKIEFPSFKGDSYRDVYGVEESPVLYTSMFDELGFRNKAMPQGGWEIAVLGDSYIEFGLNEEDTFTSILEAMSGMKTRNLGTGGYSPIQYMAVLKRYGLSPKPRYVLFSFFEGNDIAEIKDYLRWEATGGSYANFNLTGKSLLSRYVMAFRDVMLVPFVQAIGRSDEKGSRADLVDLHVGDAEIKAVFSYKIDLRSPDDMLKTNEWKILRELLTQFKAICTEHHIVPIVVFIPTKAHIYADYSTSNSGTNWLRIREQQIAAKDHVEMALQSLCRDLGVELVSLSPAYRRAAKQGRFLYYPFDTHWNTEGRQIAASVLAGTLTSKNETN